MRSGSTCCSTLSSEYLIRVKEGLWSWIDRDLLLDEMGSDAATRLGILGLGVAESFGKENIAVELASSLKELFPKATFLRCVVVSLVVKCLRCSRRLQTRGGGFCADWLERKNTVCISGGHTIDDYIDNHWCAAGCRFGVARVFL